MGMSYDALGRLRTHTYPDAETVTYSYNPAGLLYSVSGYVNEMEYDANSNLTTIRYANDVEGTFTYDPNRLWLETASFTKGENTLYEAQYTYYADGLLKTSASKTNPMNATFYYDGLHRLRSLEPGSSERAFAESVTYDTTGRIQSRNGALYEYNNPNHLHAVTRVGGSTSYSYDSNGSLLTRNGTDFVGTWNDQNLLSGVTAAGSSSVTYVYNANQQRVAEQPKPGTEKRFFGKFLEFDSSSGTLTKNYFAGPLFVARNADGVVNYFHGDRLGSTRLLTDKAGAIVGGYDYKAFGQQVPRGGTAATDIRFTGHRTAVGTGLGKYSDLIFMNARFYDPVLARFISADSSIPDSSRSQALDHYAYAYNNPISNVNPTGHIPKTEDDYSDFSDPPLVTAEGFLAQGPVTPSRLWEWAQLQPRAMPKPSVLVPVCTELCQADLLAEAFEKNPGRRDKIQLQGVSLEQALKEGLIQETPQPGTSDPAQAEAFAREYSKSGGALDKQNMALHAAGFYAALAGGAAGAAIAKKAIELPAWRKVTVDMAHILERHVPGARIAAGRTVFPSTMNEASILRAIRSAYETSSKVGVQLEGDVVRYQLQGSGAGLRIEMWFNKATNVIETAYPITR